MMVIENIDLKHLPQKFLWLKKLLPQEIQVLDFDLL
jgi:hypothetical protein